MAIEPSAVTIQERSEIAPICAMLVGSMMMPEPIMLTATTTVSCIIVIFFGAVAIVLSLFLDAQHVVHAVFHLGAFDHPRESRELLLALLHALQVLDLRRALRAEVLPRHQHRNAR